MLLPKPKLPKPLEKFPPRISQIIKKANPLREVIDDARELIKTGREEISEVAGALRIEEPEKPPETKSEGEGEGCPVCSDLTDLKEFLGKRKVKKALTELETGEGDKEKSLETVRKYIEGEDVE